MTSRLNDALETSFGIQIDKKYLERKTITKKTKTKKGRKKKREFYLIVCVFGPHMFGPAPSVYGCLKITTSKPTMEIPLFKQLKT